MLLLEGLIAILIFSLGVLGLVALQAQTIKQGGDAQYRTTAAMLANGLIGTMLASGAPFSTLQSQYDCSMGSCPGFVAWRDAQVIPVLPGVIAGSDSEPDVSVASGVISVTMYWRAPTDTVIHRFTAKHGVRNS